MSASNPLMTNDKLTELATIQGNINIKTSPGDLLKSTMGILDLSQDNFSVLLTSFVSFLPNKDEITIAEYKELLKD